MDVYWDYVLSLLLISIIIAILIKLILYKYKILEKNLYYIYIIFAGIAIYIILDLFAVFYNRENIYDGISCMYHNFYTISIIFACILYFTTAYIYNKYQIWYNITGLIGSIFYLTILYEIIENPIYYFLNGYEEEVNWFYALPELVLFIIIALLAFLNIINLIIFVIKKILKK